MRCPKCGFISFDHLETCLKCDKDIKETASNLNGSVYKVAAPAFLQFNVEPETDEVELDEAFIEEDDVFADEEIRDPDLDILLDEDSGEQEEEISITMDDEEEAVAINPGDADEDEGGIDFKLDDFQEDAELGDADDFVEESLPAKSVNIELPDELSDMSDLEPPPALAEVAELGQDEQFDIQENQEFDLDFDLNLEDEELGAAAEEAKNLDLADLSLNDFEFDEPTPAATTKKPAKSGKLDLDDEEFNFDLDLGDLKLDDE